MLPDVVLTGLRLNMHLRQRVMHLIKPIRYEFASLVQIHRLLLQAHLQAKEVFLVMKKW